MIIDWDNIYLLGWHSFDGKINLTSWVNNKSYPWIDIVVVGATDFDMSHITWAAPLHKPFEIILIPNGVNPQKFAKENNGLRSFGWYVKEGINRPPMQPIKDPWQWYNDLKKIMS